MVLEGTKRRLERYASGPRVAQIDRGVGVQRLVHQEM